MEIPNINLSASSLGLAESEGYKWKHYYVSFCFNNNNDLIGMSFVQANPVTIPIIKFDKDKDLINSLATSKGEAVPEIIKKRTKAEKIAERDKKIVEKVMKAKKEGNESKAEFLADKLNKKEEPKRNYKNKVCVDCGEIFSPSGPRSKRCDKCSSKKKNNKKEDSDEDGREELKVCPKCHNNFIPLNSNQVFCSSCEKETMKTKKCVVCGEDFIPNAPNQKCCSDKCRAIRLKLSKEPKEKKDLLTGKDFCPICLEKKPPFKNTCGIKYKCISTWNKLNNKQRERLLKKAENYAQSCNKKHGKRRKADKSDGLGESLEIFSS